MTGSQSRKHRGYRSQAIVARWFAQHGWPFAESTGAGRSGSDVTGVPGLLVEVKARRAFNPLAWLRQTKGEAETHNGLPFVVFRCDGQGEANVGEWGVLLTLADMTELLREAGYGSEPASASGDGDSSHQQSTDEDGDHDTDDDEPADALNGLKDSSHARSLLR